MYHTVRRNIRIIIQEQVQIEEEALKRVVSKLLGQSIVRVNYEIKQLHGGTLGDVKLVAGVAETADGTGLPYQVVWKTQKKWERPGDPDSWRREYDLYKSDIGTVFTDSLRWPACYHAEMNGDEIQLWMEYIQGTSGDDLTIDTLEQAAMELGRFQGRLYSQLELFGNVTCLSDVGFVQREHAQWHRQTYSYDFLCSEQCRIPGHVRQMIKDNPWNNGKTIEWNYLRSEECDIPQHLKQMLIDSDDKMETAMEGMGHLPIVLCHRDFWIENIFLSQGKIVLIDWDGAGLGRMGEDIASLIVDGTDVSCLDELYRRLVPAYCMGLSEYMDCSRIDHLHIQEMILIKFGYRIMQEYMFTDAPETKTRQITVLQKIYEMAQ